jgi:hypothetical protein
MLFFQCLLIFEITNFANIEKIFSAVSILHIRLNFCSPAKEWLQNKIRKALQIIARTLRILFPQLNFRENDTA